MVNTAIFRSNLQMAAVFDMVQKKQLSYDTKQYHNRCPRLNKSLQYTSLSQTVASIGMRTLKHGQKVTRLLRQAMVHISEKAHRCEKQNGGYLKDPIFTTK